MYVKICVQGILMKVKLMCIANDTLMGCAEDFLEPDEILRIVRLVYFCLLAAARLPAESSAIDLKSSCIFLAAWGLGPADSVERHCFAALGFACEPDGWVRRHGDPGSQRRGRLRRIPMLHHGLGLPPGQRRRYEWFNVGSLKNWTDKWGPLSFIPMDWTA